MFSGGGGQRSLSSLTELWSGIRISRIIRDFAGVTSRSNKRAGFASAHTAPCRSCSFASNDNSAFSFHKQSLFNLNKFRRLSCASDTGSHLSNKFHGFPLYQLTQAKSGFTLAEVLITLGIIGVVAAMTMPSLVQKTQDKELISRIKKTYSELNNVLLTVQADNGVIGDNSFLFNVNDNNIAVAEKLQKYFNGAKLCTNRTQQGCSSYYYQVKYATLRLDANNVTSFYDDNAPRIILSDGAVITITNSRRADCSAVVTGNKTDEYGRPILNPDGTNQTITWTTAGCAYLKFDVNGPKNPNQYGRDAYGITVARSKIYPDGTMYGGVSLQNVITGNDKLEYVNYQKGQKVEF